MIEPGIAIAVVLLSAMAFVSGVILLDWWRRW